MSTYVYIYIYYYLCVYYMSEYASIIHVHSWMDTHHIWCTSVINIQMLPKLCWWLWWLLALDGFPIWISSKRLR